MYTQCKLRAAGLETLLNDAICEDEGDRRTFVRTNAQVSIVLLTVKCSYACADWIRTSCCRMNLTIQQDIDHDATRTRVMPQASTIPLKFVDRDCRTWKSR